MKASTISKVILNIFTASIFILGIYVLIFTVIPSAFAKKGGNGGGKPPPPAPEECTDVFPSFLYKVDETRKRPAEVHLSSADGCRTEFLKTGEKGVTHVTEDWSDGVMVWSEDPEIDHQYTLLRQDFTVDGLGKPTPGNIVTLLPRDDEIISPGDSLFYFNNDVWGDANHDLLYMAVARTHGFGEAREDVIDELLFYNLNDTYMTDVHVIKRTAGSDWNLNCPEVEFPQYVPNCYLSTTGVTFNQSGTRLYLLARLDISDQTWYGILRINIGRFDLAGNELPFNELTFSPPELVYTGINGSRGRLPRPETNRYDLPFPEYIFASDSLVNADMCVEIYADLALGYGYDEPEPDLWKSLCIVDSGFNGGGESWQSPDALLSTIRTNRGRKIYRRHIDGSEELLIENGRHADSGH